MNRTSLIIRSFAILVFMASLHLSVHAQVIPTGDSLPNPPTRDHIPTPYIIPPTTINYIRTREYAEPVPYTMESWAHADSMPIKNAMESTKYLDDFGRNRQVVSKQLSPNGKDIVSQTEYDDFGRPQYQMLPFESDSSRGKYLPYFGYTQGQSLYHYYTPSDIVGGESFFYSQTIYDNSPINRVKTTYAPGKAWGGNGRGISTAYEHNNPTDSVRMWTIGTAIGSYPQSPGVYPTGDPSSEAVALYKTILTNEDGHRTIEFKDISGKLILKKQEAIDGAGAGYDDWLCTYYVYDDFGRLRYVIPPRAVELIRGSWSLANSTLRDGLSFRYEYDGRGRMIIKKLPGAAEQYFVYDKRDRLVFTQTGTQRNVHQWLVTFYDGLDRPYETALYTNANATRQSLQTMMDNADPNYYLPLTYPVPAPEDLTFNSREGNSPAEYVARSSITFLPGFESGVNDTFTAYIDPNAILGVDTLIERYPNDPVPPLSQEDIEPLTFFYYDDYSWPGHHAFIQADLNKTTDGDNPYAEKANPYMNTNGYSTRVHGLATGSRVKVLNSSPELWLTSTIYYDERGRMIQTIADNVADGLDIVSNKYSFSGKLLSSYVISHNSHSTITPETRVLTEYKYDDAGRLLTVTKKLNDESTGKIISENTYDELTRLKSKKLGDLETLNYDYNVHGWLHGINRWYANGVTGESHFFGMELDYDRGFSQGQYNGNIAGEIWRTSGDGERRAYGFSYDAPSRLSKADFTQYTSGTWNTSAGVDYTTSGIAYDPNGNLITMKQMGLISTSSSVVDSLHYYYRNGGLSNQLDNVRDNGGTSAALGDFKDAHAGSGDYSYDINGNLTKDLNKGINSITYNHLNLPELIKITGKGTIRFTYDALGNKLRKIVTDSTATPVRITTTDYLGGFIYQNDTLQFFPTEEGRVRYVPTHGSTPAAYVYDYFIKDHLGNTRVVLTEQTDFSQYLATMEPQSAQTEEALFSNLESTREARPPDYPSDGLTSPNTSVARLNGRDPGKRVGPSIILKVMAGDTLQAAVRAFYREKPNPRNNTGLPAEQMAGSLLQALALPSAAALQTHAGTPQARLSGTGPGFSGSDLQALKDKDLEARKLDKPKAYLNYVFFDKQLNFVGEGSGVKQLQGDPGQLETLTSGKVVARKSGYVYVFTSNESTQDVLFDNLGVTQITGPVLEETHYYPFGLTMAEISSTAPLKLENKYKFNGIELNNDFGISIYEAFYRDLDPQIGRYWQIDPKTNWSESPYVSMGNNSVKNVDWLGDYFTWANSTVQNTYKMMRQENNKRLKGYMSELSLLDLNSKDEGTQKKIKQLKTLINAHADLNSQWDAMEESDVEFHVSSETPIVGSAGDTRYSNSEKRINIRLGNSDKNFALMAHEFRHGYGYLNGETIAGGDDLYDMTDEIVAYNVGFLFLDRGTASLVANGYYNVDWFKNYKMTGDTYKTLSGKEASITINTPARIYIQYFKNRLANFMIQGMKNNANMVVKDAIDAANAANQKAKNGNEFKYGEGMLKNRNL